jgi:hypothetical protein
MKGIALWPICVLTIAVGGFLASLPKAHADDSYSSNGRYKILSTTSGQYAETYMLDKQNGRIWMMRGQVSQAPFLVPCVYQLLNGHTALSPLDEGTQTESTSDRFLIKSATSGDYAETYILDKQNGRVWMMRGQVSQAPSLIPCVYQLSSSRTALSPIVGSSASVPTIERFSITCVTTGKYAETYVNDVQNGAVWIMRGQVSQTPSLIPCAYQLVNGEIALLPMERHTEISLLAKNGGETTSPSTTANTNPSTLDKEVAFWQAQLANIKEGKEWRAIHGWDKDGNPILGAPQPPSASAEVSIRGIIENIKSSAKVQE